MIERTHINQVTEHLGDNTSVAGFVHAIRAQSKIVFLNIRDVTGLLQIVVLEESEVFKKAKELSLESVVKVTGLVKEAKNVPFGVEIEAHQLEVLSDAAPELPIPVVIKAGEDTDAPLRFDYRWLDLRKPRKTQIFQVWTALEKGFRNYWLSHGYTQLYTPAFMSTPSESGAEVFEVEYFDRKAYLAQSPQFYKQMGIASGFEKVFMVGPVFRAEHSFTTRHLTEFTGWDFEIGYIESHHDLMNEEEAMIVAGFTEVKTLYPELNIEIPKQPFPRISIVEAKKILNELTIPSEEEHDLSPEEERAISTHIKEKMDHDFVFITDYHKSKSAFYHMRHEQDNDRSKRADLLYRGIEITTLAQREHRLEVLKKQAQEKGMSSESLEDYMNFFRYGCPPHGGGGIGPGRLVMKMLDLPNIREATYLPRDVKRLNP